MSTTTTGSALHMSETGIWPLSLSPTVGSHSYQSPPISVKEKRINSLVATGPCQLFLPADQQFRLQFICVGICCFLVTLIAQCFCEQREQGAKTKRLCLEVSRLPSFPHHTSTAHATLQRAEQALDLSARHWIFLHKMVISLLQETAGKSKWALSRYKLMLTLARIMYSPEPLHLWRQRSLLVTWVYMHLSAKSEHHLHKSSTWETSWDLW